jgi:hypothetical protein
LVDLVIKIARFKYWPIYLSSRALKKMNPDGRRKRIL